ncbi:MAG: hypothetical protein UT63_C0063G0015 [Candidatus Gottesmanbacteria bacterium GW2011_GWC2_39_8]|uniref:Uncharacterized protein n=1 Tax=Candidatus Gottesmanbacteria bacterium GW2011_GWC2_39_8 TaxID=1618450 RepID=A0A0G0T1L1_9BACT|nr:MAG: hypothetical protein UT63_C0063G0015 [Candidatus Gottesmanbacteria bacterium GW2011_GWC2_39_8]
MKNLNKIGAIVGTVAILAANIVSPVLAAGNNATNSTTGPLSSNYTDISNTSKVKVENVSDAHIKNDVTVVSNTGHNSASMNTLGGTVVSGNANVNATLNNTANVNTTSVTGGPQGSGVTAANLITGPLSDNRANVENKNKVEVENDNTLWLDNKVDALSDTGYNTADTNTGPGSVRSGNASTTLSVVNRGNDSATDVSGAAGGNGGNLSSNETTGPLSTNYSDILNSAEADIDNVSDARVKNNVLATGNSGHNSGSVNTLGGSVVSGNASTGVGLDTTANINTTSVAMAMGGFTNMGGNDVTGPDSDNRNSITNKYEVEVENINNKCESRDCKDYDGPWGVFNQDVDTADTGYNVADTNTGMASAVSGLASVLKNIKVWMNDSLTVVK